MAGSLFVVWTKEGYGTQFTQVADLAAFIEAHGLTTYKTDALAPLPTWPSGAYAVIKGSIVVPALRNASQSVGP